MRWIRCFVVPAASLLLAAACGARTGLVDPLRDAGGDRVDGASLCPARLRSVGAPRTVFGAQQHGGGRVAARAGGFDFLARRSGPPLQLVARQGRIVAGQLSLSSDAVILAAGGSGLAVDVADERLFVCHTTYNGDPIKWAAFRGAYARVSERQLFSNGARCTGIAYRARGGMAAAHKRPPDRSGLSRAIVFAVDRNGAVTSAEELALPAGDLAFAALASYQAGFAWAGYASSLKSMRVTFRPDTGADRTATVPTDYLAASLPEIAAYSRDRVAVSWNTADARARVVVVREDGRVDVDHAIDRPAARWVTSVSLAETRCGLALAYSVCPHQGEGTGYVVLLGSAGEVVDSLSFPACSPVRLAVIGDTLAVMWSEDGRYDARLVRLEARGR